MNRQSNHYRQYDDYRGGGGRRDNVGRSTNAYRKPAGMRPSRGDYRLQILGLSSATSWQDLKDFGRTAGESVVYGDVVVDGGRRLGVIEYTSKDDYLYALEKLNGEKLHGKVIRVYKDGDAPPIDSVDLNDNSSDRSSPRLHDRERHNTRRSYRRSRKERGDDHHHRGRKRRSRHERSYRSRKRRRSSSRSVSSSRSRSRSRSRRKSHRSRRRRSSRRERQRRSRSGSIDSSAAKKRVTETKLSNHSKDVGEDKKSKSGSIQ